MDPDATLAELRRMAKTHAVMGDPLGVAFEDLDRWITNGGFLPTAWRATAGAHYHGMETHTDG